MNRIGLALVFANIILIIWGLSEKEWSYNSFHFYYEPIAIKIITLINFPAMLFEALIYNWFLPPQQNFSTVFISDSEMILIVLLSIFQWLLIGYLLNLTFLSNQKEIK